MRTGTQTEYAILLAIAYLTPPLLWLLGGLSPWSLLPWLTVPLAARLIRETRTTTGRALNKTLGGTGQLELLYSILLAAGILLPRACLLFAGEHDKDVHHTRVGLAPHDRRPYQTRVCLLDGAQLLECAQ